MTATTETSSNLHGAGAEPLAAAVLLDIVVFAATETELFWLETKYKLLSTIRATLKKPILNVVNIVGTSNNRDRDLHVREIKVPFIKST
jgi:GTP1/Obg family GTP-binding protein